MGAGGGEGGGRQGMGRRRRALQLMIREWLREGEGSLELLVCQMQPASPPRTH